MSLGLPMTVRPGGFCNDLLCAKAPGLTVSIKAWFMPGPAAWALAYSRAGLNCQLAPAESALPRLWETAWMLWEDDSRPFPWYMTGPHTSWSWGVQLPQAPIAQRLLLFPALSSYLFRSLCISSSSDSSCPKQREPDGKTCSGRQCEAMGYRASSRTEKFGKEAGDCP